MTEKDAMRDLPGNWTWTTIGAITKPINTFFPGDNPDNEFIYLDISSIDNAKNRVVDPKTYLGKEAPSRARQLVYGNDILFSTVRTYLKNIALVPEFYEEAVASTGFSVLRPEDGVFFKYLFYYVLTDEFITSIEPFQKGTSYPAVRDSDVRNLQFPLAPTNEQYHIVDEIEAQFSRLDTWLEVMNKLREQLPRLRASILKAAVEGRLIEQNPHDESAEALLQRILGERRREWEADYHTKRGERGESLPLFDNWEENYPDIEPPDTSDLPDLPEGWIWATVEQIGEVRLGRQRSPSKRSKDYPTKYIRAANITEQGLDLRDILEMEFTPEEREIYRLQKGDIVIAEASGSPDQVGKSAIWNDEIEDCCFQNTVIRLRAPHLNSRYLLIVLEQFYRSGVLARTARGVGINHLSAGRFARLAFPLAPERQQYAIADEVSLKLSVIDRLEETIKVNVKRAERMRQSVLKKAFEGRLVEQNQNGESASELLERIRAERQRIADEERQKPKQQRERKVSTQFERRSLYETLMEAGEPLSVRELFQQAGFTHTTIDDFYEELREAVYKLGTIRSHRNKNNEIFLEVTG